MSDCEAVKLVDYKISFVKDGLEAVLFHGEDMVTEAQLECDTSFEVWKTAEFIQDLSKNPRAIPPIWKKDGEPVYPPKEFRADGNYNGLPEDDKKYLRFYQDTLATYQRDKANYERDQASALESINRTLLERLKK